MQYDYMPDKWALLHIPDDPDEICQYRIISGWSGGYLSSDEWRISSGITKVIEHKHFYEIHNASGSTYKCRKKSYGFTSYSAEILIRYKKMENIHVLNDIKDLPTRCFGT